MKIKLVSTTPHGACSYYRSVGVLKHLKDVEVDIVDVSKYNWLEWHNIIDYDILFMERPFTVDQLTAIKYAKDFNIKIWVDFDDNLFDLPDWNPSFKLFDDNAKKTMARCMELADVVTVPTEQLQEEFFQYNKNVKIVPNAFNDFNFELKYQFSEDQKILWRGSNTHRGDVLHYLQEIVETARINPDWEWNFIAKDMWYVTDYIKNKKLHPELPLVSYFNRLRSISPGIYLAVLYPNKFNLSKSNCGWIEATYAGAVTIAPYMPEWVRPGIINYKDQAEFKEKLQILIEDEDKRRMNHKASFDYIRKNLVLSQVNKKRIKILEEL